MNQHRLTTMLIAIAMVVFLISCGGSGSGEKSATDTSAASPDTSAATTTPAPVNTIVTTPQNMVIIRHKVADYDKWKPAYDAHDSARLADGLHSFVIGRDVSDPNMITVALKADDLAKAKAFAKDPGLKKAMQKGGVTGVPSIKFYTMVFMDTSTIDSKLRNASVFKVKDWDAWKKSFDSTRALNSDNGLKARAYGYDPDDHHNVILVGAILDTAKANAYFKSDILKKRRAAAGVVGTPERFIYQIVQKY